MSLSAVVAVVRRRLLTIVTVAVLAAAVAVAVGGSLLGGSYTARAVVTLTPLPDNPITGTQARNVSTTTESSVVTSTSVAELAAQSLGWSASTRDLLSHVSVASPLDSQVLQISFEGGSPQQAADGANAFATSYLAYRKQVAQNQIDAAVARLQTQIDTLTKQADAAQERATSTDAATRAKAQTAVRQLSSLVQGLRQQVSAAQSSPTDAGQLAGRALAPISSSGPATSALAAGGLVVGLLAGTALAFVRDGRDRRVRDVARLEEVAGAPCLARLRLDGGTADDEPLRRLTAALTDERLGPNRRVVVLAASDAAAADTAAQISTTLASAGRRTLLLGVADDASGLVEAAGVEAAVNDAELPAGTTIATSGLLDLVSVGPERRLPAEVASPSERLSRLLSQDGDTTIVLDAVNVEHASSAMLLARLGGRCIVLADSQRTTIDDLARLRQDLALVGAEVVGVALTEAPRRNRTATARRRAKAGAGAGTAGKTASGSGPTNEHQGRHEVTPPRSGQPTPGSGTTRETRRPGAGSSGRPAAESVKPAGGMR